MSGALHDQLQLLIPKVKDDLRAVLEDVWDELPVAYRLQLDSSITDLAGLLARDVAGEDVDAELRHVKAQIMLWSWAGAAQARRAMLLALKNWITRLQGLAMTAVEAGLQTLIRAGLEELS